MILDSSFVTQWIDFTTNFDHDVVPTCKTYAKFSYSSFVSAARARFEYRTRITNIFLDRV